MGTTRIIADIDRNVIHGQYIRKILAGEDTSPVDLTVKLIHRYITPQNTVKEIDLHEIVIPSEFLISSSGLPGTTEVEQITQINIANPRYIKDLFLEISEVRETSPIITRVPILIGTDDADFPALLPDQPYKDPEHETNIPSTLPEKNISKPVQDFQPIIYQLSKHAATLVQASQRIFLSKDELGNKVFKTQAYNESVTPRFIENAITNYLPNPGFIAGTGTPNTPDKWKVDAPGLMMTSKIENGDVTDTKTWTVRISNTNPFNAFDTATITTTENSVLMAGLNSLTISFFYMINSDFQKTPFSNFNLKIMFYNVLGDQIGTESETVAVGAEGCVWLTAHTTVQGSQIPPTATEFRFELEIPTIGSADPFELKLHLPQAESIPYFTTRTLTDRVQDTYETAFAVDLKPPVYFLAKAYHIIGPGTRGLVSTTTALKNGFHFLASSDRLRLKAFDVNGLCIFNVGSDTFTANEGTATEYGVYIDGSVVEFYLNGALLSTHSQVYALNQIGVKPRIGALESSNTTINSELLDWKILKIKPS